MPGFPLAIRRQPRLRQIQAGERTERVLLPSLHVGKLRTAQSGFRELRVGVEGHAEAKCVIANYF